MILSIFAFFFVLNCYYVTKTNRTTSQLPIKYWVSIGLFSLLTLLCIPKYEYWVVLSFWGFSFLLWLSQIISHKQLKDLQREFALNDIKHKKLIRDKEQEKSINILLEKKQFQLDIIYEGMKELNKSLVFENSLNIFATTLNKIIQASNTFLILFPNESYQPEKIYQLLSKSIQVPYKHEALNLTPFQQWCLQQICTHTKTYHFNNPKIECRGELHTNDLPKESMTAIPLTHEKNILAVLFLSGISSNHLSSIEILSMHFAMEIRKTRLYMIVKNLSVIDGLTQVYLRRHLMNLLKTECSRLKNNKLPLSVLLIDVDHFKNVNDTYGHLVGDKILKDLVQIIKTQLRPFDMMGRYGGEEFIIGLPESNKLEASVIADRFRQSIMNHDFESFGNILKLSISIGVATFPDDHIELEQVIQYADEALYLAKHKGRNQVQTYFNDAC